jgi:PAS domain-containing protein
VLRPSFSNSNINRQQVKGITADNQRVNVAAPPTLRSPNPRGLRHHDGMHGTARTALGIDFQEVFDTSNDVIFIHDAATGAILEVNQAMLAPDQP